MSQACRLYDQATVEAHRNPCLPESQLQTLQDLHFLVRYCGVSSSLLYGPVGVGKRRIAICLAFELDAQVLEIDAEALMAPGSVQ